MKNRSNANHNANPMTAAAKAVVATVFVVGLACLALLRVDQGSSLLAPSLAVAASSGAAATSDFLRAPTTDPSLPSLEATFPVIHAAPAEDAPAPTF